MNLAFFRRYVPYNNMPMEPFTGRETRTLFDLNLYNRATLLLEARQPNTQFQNYNPNRMRKWKKGKKIKGGGGINFELLDERCNSRKISLSITRCLLPFS
jgi:hypothetical protein